MGVNLFERLLFKQLSFKKNNNEESIPSDLSCPPNACRAGNIGVLYGITYQDL